MATQKFRVLLVVEVMSTDGVTPAAVSQAISRDLSGTEVRGSGRVVAVNVIDSDEKEKK